MAGREPRLLRLIEEDSSNVCSILFHDVVLITGSEDGAIREWSLQTFRPHSVVQQRAESPILCLRSFGRGFLSREKNGPICLWEKQDSKWVSSLLMDKSFGFSNIDIDNDVVFVPCEKGSVQMYSLETRRKVAELKHGAQLMSLKVVHLSNSPYLLTAHEDGDVCLWDLATTQIVNKLQLSDCVAAVEFSDVTQSGLCGSVTDQIHSFTIDSALGFHMTKTLQIVNEGVNCIHVRPDNKIAALGCWDGRVRVFSWRSAPHPLAVLDQFESPVRDLCFVNHKPVSKDGRSYILVACGDKYVAFWDLYN